MLTLSQMKYWTLIFAVFTFAATYYKVYDGYIVISFGQDVSKLDKHINCSIRNPNGKQEYFDFNGILYPKKIPFMYDAKINLDCLNLRSPKLILFYTDWVRNKPFNVDIFRGCPVKSCVGTNNKMLIDKSDIVVFHMTFYAQLDKLPKRPSYSQQWLFLIYESPMHTRLTNKFNGVFNLSSTYKKSSNVNSYYNRDFFWRKNDNYSLSIDRSKGKTVFASILVSNCKKFRLDYVKEMRKYVEVKTFGKCGEPCPVNQTDNCKKDIAKISMFYLAFENAICDDYITEKFFEILRYDVVPVVLGGGDYEYYVPKEGFINALDFNSPKELSEYLIYLSENSTAYNSFFKWKRFINFGLGNNHLCEMCIMAHLAEGKHSVIEDIDEFYTMKTNCAKHNIFVEKLNNLTLKTLSNNSVV